MLACGFLGTPIGVLSLVLFLLAEQKVLDSVGSGVFVVHLVVYLQFYELA